jgi:hypothetical protein
MAEKRRARIGLAEGKSHTGPDGYRWIAGKFRTMSEDQPFFKHYTTHPRFSHQDLRPDESEDGPPRRGARRSRHNVREDRQEREQRRADDREPEEELGEEIEEEIEDEDDPPPPPKPAVRKPPAKKKPSEALLKNARRNVPDDIPREAAELLAHKLGIEGAAEIADLPTLVSKITQRQAEILADAAGG